MDNLVKDYIKKVLEAYESGHAREHAYRPALHDLFRSITGLNVINDPKKSEFGAPDFVFLKPSTFKEKITIAYAEAKDIDVILDDIEKGEQMGRYYGYSNIILTNGLDFRFFRHGQSYNDPIIIGKLTKGGIEVFSSSFTLLGDTISAFISESKEPIRSGAVLSKVMAGKARRIRNNVKKFLEDDKNQKNDNLLNVYGVIKKLLIADIDYSKFADMYAQTIVYGLFVARYNDETQENFTRQEARDLIPPSNPFLREFFNHIAGSSFDKRIEYIVNELCEEFNHADVREIIHKYYKTDLFGKIHESKDPIIHFYEDFLEEYDPEERKKMGVFYTPLPVVRFIIRAVDDILKKEFDLPEGLSDNKKIEITREVQGKRHKTSTHKVQVLDPATGTGTFLNETILHIRRSFEGQEGRWSSYVNEDLLPRVHGFELMMASYTIAHLKLSSTITESGARVENTRLGVYLTNSLEKTEIEEKTLFDIGLGKAITEESNQANKVKNELPIMVVMGNPPYSVSSQNKGEWIQDLITEYKRDLNEKKINLDDDYIKFIRLSESLIEKNRSGIVAMITNNSFIDGITHRQMRKHLLETFNSIYIIDLHGNSKKKEKTPSGAKDENVFNIMQGVSINIFVKKDDQKGLGSVYHSELYGKREDKFKVLNEKSVGSIEWADLKYSSPYYFFTPKDFTGIKEYEDGFKVDKVFKESVSGVESVRDNLTIHFAKKELEKVVMDFVQLNEKDISVKYNTQDARDWKIARAKEDIISSFDNDNNFRKIAYRPFDNRDIYYTGKQNGFVCNSRFNIMRHMLQPNIALVAKRGFSNDLAQPGFITNKIFDRRGWSSPGMQGAESIFPLYLYENGTKVSNLEKEIVDNIEKVVGPTHPEDIVDYIYAVLYSRKYREKYKEFLKIDFPRIPYPQDKETFSSLVSYGQRLREVHLLNSSKITHFTTTFTEDGLNNIEVKYPKYKNDKVYINDQQYFGFVPEVAWNFYIGGYQPAQKWLKDRRGRVLSGDEIVHYQKIIMSILETLKIMDLIEEVL